MRTRLSSFVVLNLLASVVLTAQQKQLPDGPGKAAAEKVCGNCHGVQIVFGRGHTKDQWTHIVMDMVQRGAEGTEDEFADVVDYLAKYFPPEAAAKKINVNKASADELKQALDLTAKQADAIVEYRKQNGDITSFEQLKKVQGLDTAKLTSKKYLIAF